MGKSLNSDSLFDLDGSSLVGEIDEDFADTFCQRDEESKLEFTRFRSNTSEGDDEKIEEPENKLRLINDMAELSYSAVR
jgi:hypothetical protein